eukprot:TRINITY_DN10869_c0_g1_i1.p1 TRINITY_DN10869_c0_g1~~TRINITY_DN10869_c0_g1_i1.p1  ORF type:complete len:239 (-),score=54.18 TRINITY_DN10869_c0_g1_i1:223-939(-)
MTLTDEFGTFKGARDAKQLHVMTPCRSGESGEYSSSQADCEHSMPLQLSSLSGSTSPGATREGSPATRASSAMPSLWSGDPSPGASRQGCCPGGLGTAAASDIESASQEELLLGKKLLDLLENLADVDSKEDKAPDGDVDPWTPRRVDKPYCSKGQRRRRLPVGQVVKKGPPIWQQDEPPQAASPPDCPMSHSASDRQAVGSGNGVAAVAGMTTTRPMCLPTGTSFGVLSTLPTTCPR